jgi:transposase
MIQSLTTNRQVWVYMQPTDLRKSYDCLYGLARSFHSSPRNGDIFLFVSSDRKKAKALFWERNGFMILMKRLEAGTFAKIFSRGKISQSELNLFFEGSHQVEKNLSTEDLTDRFLD